MFQKNSKHPVFCSINIYQLPITVLYLSIIVRWRSFVTTNYLPKTLKLIYLFKRVKYAKCNPSNLWRTTMLADYIFIFYFLFFLTRNTEIYETAVRWGGGVGGEHNGRYHFNSLSQLRCWVSLKNIIVTSLLQKVFEK